MGLRWIRLERVGSTNAYLSDLLRRENLKQEVVVTADYQDAGRGQGNNRWHSNSGENLLMSVLLFPVFLSASHQFALSRAVSLALCDVFQSFRIDTRIKWPNDILAGGGKIAGILIEHTVSGRSLVSSIAGIGLNLNQAVFPPFGMPATSVVLETGMTTTPQQVAGEIYEALQQRMAQLREGSCDALDEAYHSRLHRMREVTVFVSENRTFRGIITGVNEYGELLVEEQGLLRAYGFHQIRYARY